MAVGGSDPDGFDTAHGPCRCDRHAVVALPCETDAAAVGYGDFAGDGCRTVRARRRYAEKLLEAQRIGCCRGDAQCQRILAEAVVAAQEQGQVAQRRRVGIRQHDSGRVLPRDRIGVRGVRPEGLRAASGRSDRRNRSRRRSDTPDDAFHGLRVLCVLRRRAAVVAVASGYRTVAARCAAAIVAPAAVIASSAGRGVALSGASPVRIAAAPARRIASAAPPVAVVAGAVALAPIARGVVRAGFGALCAVVVAVGSLRLAAFAARGVSGVVVRTLLAVARTLSSAAAALPAAPFACGTAAVAALSGVFAAVAALLLRSGALRFALGRLLAAAAVTSAPFAAFGLVETGDAVLLGAVGRLLGLVAQRVGVLQPVGLLALTVQGENLPDAGDGKRRGIDHRLLRRGEGHRAGQHVALDEEPLAVDRLQGFAQARELLAGVHIGVVFVHHAALEFRALPGQLLRVERNVLHARGARRDAREARHPRGAAQLAAAGAEPADAARLLPCADLLHLDPYVEPLGEDLDQLAEVHALVGDIVEDGLDLVALVLHVADLHVQSHVGGDLPRGDHRLVFEGDGLLPAFDVVGLGLAVDLPELAVVGVEARAAHLPRDQVARERDDADVVAGRSLHGHDVASFERQVVDILVERAAGVLEAHLDDVARDIDGVLLEPRRLVEFEAAVAGLRFDFGAAVAEGAAAAYFGFESVVMRFFGIHRRHNLRKDTKKISIARTEFPDAAADAADEQHGGRRQPHGEAQIKPRGAHAEREAEQVAHREVEQPVGDQRDGHDDLHVLDAAQHAHRDVLDAVRELIEGGEDEQRGGRGDDLGVRGEEGRDEVAQRDEHQRREGVPCQHEVIGGFGRQRQFADVACAVAVRDADGRRRADRHDDHEGAVAQRDGDLVGAHGDLAEPAHHDSRADEGRGFEEHLHGDRQAHVHEPPHDLGREHAVRESVEVAAVAPVAAEVADDQGGGQHAREQRAQSGALGAHLRKTETSVDEDRVEADVRQVGQDRHDHFDLRVADALEELLEREEQHHERHAEDEHPVVGNGHFDHLDGLFEVVHQRDDGILHAGHDQSQQRVEEDAVLEQGGRADPVLLGVKLPHEGREAQRHADGGDEEDEEHGAAERHGGQRRGVVASVAADHEVVGHLRENLSHLRQHDRQRQPQVLPVLLPV